MNRLFRRLRRLEPPKPRASYPHVVEYDAFGGETQDEAVARHIAKHGRPRTGGLMVVPKTMTIEQWKAIAAEKTRERQAKLIADAKSVSAEILKDHNNGR